MRSSLISLILIASFNISCSPGSKDSVRVWVNYNHATCEMQLHNDITSLPNDLAISLNRSDLPRYDSFMSFRPWVISTDLVVKDYGSDLIEPDKKGQQMFTIGSWSIDGQSLYLNKNWIEPQHAMLEEATHQFLMDVRYYRTDIIRRTDSNSENLTADSFSFFNSNAILSTYVPNKVIFTALENNEMKSFIMNHDGSNKEALQSTSGFSYGLSISPDGTRYAFHSEYKIYVGDFNSGIETKVNTPCAFNFGPVWSPDSSKIAFLCGATNVGSDIYTADRDGNNVSLLGTRDGYEGVVPFMDGYDYHGGGTDRYAWSANSESVIYGKKIGTSVELVQSFLDGSIIQLTNSAPNTLNSYPGLKGSLLVYNVKVGSNSQNTFYMDLNNKQGIQITDLKQGCSSRAGLWKP